MLTSLDINLIVVFIVCLFSWLGFLKLTRGIKTAIGGGACDNSYLIKATSKSNEWGWPSDMHIKTYTGTSTSQRDITVLLLVLFQKIFRDKDGEFPIIALWGFANAASAFIIYLIGTIFWGSNIGLALSILYLSTFWMWQMSLFVAHLNVGTMFFLLSVYFLMQALGGSLISLWFFVAGISFCCMLFSSSSSPRYILLFFTAAFYSKYKISTTIFNWDTFIISLILTLIFALFLTVVRIFYKQIITAIYNRKAGIFNGLIIAKKYALEHYINTGKEKLINGVRLIIKPYVFIFIVINVLGFNFFIPILVGFLCVFIFLNLPNIKKNFTFYFNYLYISYVKPGINSGLVRYVRYGYFEKNKLKIPSNLRGGGIWWVPKIYFRMAPFHTIIYIFLIFILLIIKGSSLTLLSIILTSLLPIIWAEMTMAYQVSRSYSSGLIGFMILIGYGAFSLQAHLYFWRITISILALTITWNCFKFFGIIYPARMSFNKITKFLKNNNITEIYTYNTFYNDCFFDNLKSPPAPNLKVNFIKSLEDVQDGWILIPPTTHKAGYINQEGSIQQGDFKDDPILNNLLETKNIEKIAQAKFKTIYGSDNIWLQEQDIMTYFDLLLHYVTDKDRFRGYAWILHSSTLTK